MDLAVIGLEAHSEGIRRATKDLDKMSGAAKRAEGAADTLTASTKANTVATNASAMAFRAQASAASAAAFQSRQLSFQLVDIGQALVTAPTMGIYALQNLGFQVAQIGQLYIGRGGFNQAIKDSARQVGAFAARMGPLAVAIGVAAGAIAGMTYEINKTSAVTVSFGNVFTATIQVIAERINRVLKPAIESISGPIASTWNWIVEKTKWLGNLIINSFRAAASDIKFIWNQIPNIVGSAAIGAANATIRAIEQMINSATDLLNRFAQKANSILPQSMQMGQLGKVSFGQIDNPYATDLATAGAAHQQAIQGIMSSDPLGGFYSDVADQAQRLAVATSEAATAANATKDAWAGLRGEVDPVLEAFRREFADTSPFVTYQSQMDMINDLLERGKISMGEWANAAIRAKAQVAAAALGLAGQLGGALATMFGDSKSFAIANAIISTAEGIAKAISIYGPTPWGMAAAGVAAATGAAQIATIQRTNPGSTTKPTVSGSGGAISAANGNAPSQSAQAVNITLQGQVYSRESVEMLIEQINEATSDGNKLIVRAG